MRELDHPMVHLLITADVDYARQAVEAGVQRIFIDLERHGKAERQAGRGAHLTTHEPDDIERMKAALPDTELLVRINPVHEGTEAEVEDVIARGADFVMLPFFRTLEEVERFLAAVAGRARTVLLFETAAAVARAGQILQAAPAVGEAYLGLNDLSLDLGLTFMFEPLAGGMVDGFAAACHSAGIPFGFGGIARLGEGALPAERILGEHVRLGSTRVILSRTFQRFADQAEAPFPAAALAGLQAEARRIAHWDAAAVSRNSRTVIDLVKGIARGHASERPVSEPRRVALFLPASVPRQAPDIWRKMLADLQPNVVVRALDPASPSTWAGEEDVLIAPPVDALPDLFDALPSLRWLHLLSAGSDRMDELGLRERVEHVTTSAGVNAAAIAETVLAWMLAEVKDWDHFRAAQAASRWDRRWLAELAGLRMGIVGLGSVGVELALRARACGFHVQALRRSGRMEPGVGRLLDPGQLDQLLQTSDVVVVLLPLTDDTRGMIGEREVGLMPPGSRLAHVSRGGVVDEAAVRAALEQGHLAGALLDVYEREPLPPTDPLWQTPGLSLLPHVSGTTNHFQARAAACFVRTWRDG